MAIYREETSFYDELDAAMREFHSLSPARTGALGERPKPEVVVEEVSLQNAFGPRRETVSLDDDNSDIGQIGACCLPDGTCKDLTETNCLNANGTWGGVESACATEVCGCMDSTSCTYNASATIDNGRCIYPGISFVCDSISASTSKCGTVGFLGVGQYLSYVHHRTFHQLFNNPPGTDLCPDHVTHVESTDELNYDITQTVDFDSSCVESHTCSGTETDHNFDSCGFDRTVDYDPCVNSLFSQTGTWNCDSPSTTNTSRSQTCTWNPAADGWVGTSAGNSSSDEELSSEFTTSLLISNTIAALPAYPGTFTGSSCSASRDLTTDTNTYSIRRFKYKFTFTAQTVGFTIHWTVDGSSMSEFISAGATQSSVHEVLEPGSNGTAGDIEDITCSI